MKTDAPHAVTPWWRALLLRPTLAVLPTVAVLSVVVALLVLVALPAVANAAPDPAKVVGPDACGDCHKPEVAAWKETHHSKTFSEMVRSEKGREIAKRMGVKRIKRSKVCSGCHFTSKIEGGKLRTISGTSCESCHGPAKAWVEVHGDYGGRNVSREAESAAHRTARIKKVKQVGMIRPDQLYRLARNCYQCHLVLNEKLVNTGGHKVMTNFELLSWSQGEVRHNFSDPQHKGNRPASAERRRMLFLVGQAIELEYSLRAVGEATQKATYAVTMAKRVKRAIARMSKIQATVRLPELGAMLKVAKSAKLSLSNRAPLRAAADRVGKYTRMLAGKHDGSKLAALDPMIPGPAKYKGQALDNPR